MSSHKNLLPASVRHYRKIPQVFRQTVGMFSTSSTPWINVLRAWVTPLKEFCRLYPSDGHSIRRSARCIVLLFSGYVFFRPRRHKPPRCGWDEGNGIRRASSGKDSEESPRRHLPAQDQKHGTPLPSAPMYAWEAEEAPVKILHQSIQYGIRPSLYISHSFHWWMYENAVSRTQGHSFQLVLKVLSGCKIISPVTSYSIIVS